MPPVRPKSGQLVLLCHSCPTPRSLPAGKAATGHGRPRSPGPRASPADAGRGRQTGPAAGAGPAARADPATGRGDPPARASPASPRTHQPRRHWTATGTATRRCRAGRPGRASAARNTRPRPGGSCPDVPPGLNALPEPDALPDPDAPPDPGAPPDPDALCPPASRGLDAPGPVASPAPDPGDLDASPGAAYYPPPTTGRPAARGTGRPGPATPRPVRGRAWRRPAGRPAARVDGRSAVRRTRTGRRL